MKDRRSIAPRPRSSDSSPCSVKFGPSLTKSSQMDTFATKLCRNCRFSLRAPCGRRSKQRLPARPRDHDWPTRPRAWALRADTALGHEPPTLKSSSPVFRTSRQRPTLTTARLRNQQDRARRKGRRAPAARVMGRRGRHTRQGWPTLATLRLHGRRRPREAWPRGRLNHRRQEDEDGATPGGGRHGLLTRRMQPPPAAASAGSRGIQRGRDGLAGGEEAGARAAVLEANLVKA